MFKDSLVSIYILVIDYPLYKTIVNSKVFPIYKVRYKLNYICFIYILRYIILFNIEIRSNIVLFIKATNLIKYKLVKIYIKYILNT